MHRHTTWYVLEDGSAADPNEVAPGEDGVLRHSSGVAVRMRESGVPLTRGGIDPDSAEAEPAKEPKGKTGKGKEAKPDEGGTGYKTRESKTKA